MLGFLPLLFSYCEYNVRSIQSRGVLRVVTCCLVIRTAVTILLGISVATVRVVAVRLRLIYMLQHNRCGGNHPLFEGGELGVGHVAEPFRDRIGRKMQIQGLRWAAIAAVQKRRRSDIARRRGIIVLGKHDQGVDRQARKLAGFYHQVANRPTICHQVANRPTICAGWAVRARSEFRKGPRFSTGRQGFHCGPLRTNPCLFGYRAL
jgi:hypothetical protein